VGALVAAMITTGCAAGTEPERAPAEDVVPAPAALAAQPTWAVTGAMSVARQSATATRLADGHVLIAGGTRFGSVDAGDVYSETAELFDPATGTFAVLPAKMARKRSQHAALAIAGGKVLVVGGIGGALSTSTAELFNPATAKWTSTPALAHERWGASLTLLIDGRALLLGGDPGVPGGAAEIFNPALGTWTDLPPMSVARRYHTATLLESGRVLVVGGQAPDTGSITPSVELFNPVQGTWSKVAPLLTARTGHTATRLDDGTVLVVGGTTSTGISAAVERYDPAQNAWTAQPALASARAIHTATRLDNGAVLVAGGLDATSSALGSSELFDPATATWVASGLLGHGRFGHVAEAFADGAVLVAGGEYQSTAEVYRPTEVGEPCEVDPQCASGHCVDRVCCGAMCSGPCVTCALPGAEGTCSPATPGTDPHGKCGAGGPCDSVCDAASTCSDRVGQACAPTTCSADGTAAIEGATCAAIGAACASITVGCAPYRCGESGSPATLGCLAKCGSIDDCAAGYACDAEGKCRTRPDVAAIEVAACMAGPRSPGTPRAIAVWLAGLALVTAARRAARRPS
jgi:hypothetical protein